MKKLEGHSAPGWQLALGTISLTVCFAAWGLIGAFAPFFRERFSLSATQTAMLVAIPVLLGALGRLPVGMLGDRFGGRIVLALLMVAMAVPSFLIPRAKSYSELLIIGFFLGLAGSSFSVGAGFVSRWYSPEKQGSALGIYGLGNIGQSAAIFLGPLLAVSLGWQKLYQGAAILFLIWAAFFWIFARNPPKTMRPAGFGEMISVLTKEPLAWVLSLLYFLTFGGFIALALYLPTLLRDEFGLSMKDAGFRAAGFVVLATLLRPVGGWLSDKIGGARVLSGVFIGVTLSAMLMAWHSMVPFTVGALTCAALLGLGNGAVFKLVPQYFSREAGTVSGLVGAFGGLGGFFPPLLLGIFHQTLGVVWPGFILLSASAAALWLLNSRVLLKRQRALELTLSPELTRTADRVRAGAWATFWAGLLVASIVVGSRKLQNFDAALVIYTFASIFATWGIAYHYFVWLQKPPTKVYWRRGWELFLQQGALKSIRRLSTLTATNMLGQTFIFRRSRLRWWMHQFLFWGCILAALVTFPLVFGWIYFGSAPGDQMTYISYVFGFPVNSMKLRTVFSWTIFHLLDIAAILVLAGITLSLWRRMLDRGARAVQSFAMDLFPIFLLFAISITGLALTVSSLWFRGIFYDFLAIIHAVTVVAALLFLPFGKFFHIFQRPAQLGVKLYHEAGNRGEGAFCARCGERFASRMHIDDLKYVLPQLGFDYTTEGPGGNWQELCPACKRKTIAGAQRRLKKPAHG